MAPVLVLPKGKYTLGVAAARQEVSSPGRIEPSGTTTLIALYGLGTPCCSGANLPADDQGDGFTHANGWYGTLNWALFKRVGLTFSQESYWGAYRESSLNQHVFLAGLTFKLRKKEHRLNPFLQPFGGVTRFSYAGAIENQPTFELAAGADIRLKGTLSLEIIPAEYAFAHGTPGVLNNYQAGTGLEYTFRRKRR